MSKVRSLTELCGVRLSVESYVAPKSPLQCKCCQRLGNTQRNCGYALRCVACGGAHLTGGCSTPREQPQCCGCGGNHTGSYRGCIKWKEARAALANQAPERVRKSATTGHRAAPKAQRAGPSAEQVDLGEGWNDVVRGGRVIKATTTTPQILTLLLSRSLRRRRSIKRPPPGRRLGLRSPSLNLEQPLSRLLGTQRSKHSQVSKPRPPNTRQPNWWPRHKLPPPRSRTSLISSIGSASKLVWSCIIGSSRSSPPSPHEQYGHGLS